MEKDKKGVAEWTGEKVRNAGIVVALLGTVLWLATVPIGETLFVAGAAGGVAGEVGKNAAGGNKKK